MCALLGCPCCGNWPDADRRGEASTGGSIVVRAAQTSSTWNGPLRPSPRGGYEPAPLRLGGQIVVEQTRPKES